ncbi:MAG: rhomboid family intramembrane serine protease [Chloroflexota bacterium]
MIGLMWVLELVDQLLLRQWLNGLGIRPRSISGLWGILFAPFLHGGLAHLVANTVPFLILGWLVLVRRTSDFFIVTVVVMLLGGLGVWLLAPGNTVHIGASGLIFGYIGYLLLRGYFERGIVSIAIAVAVAFFYGGALWGVLPNQPGISWQGHLFGFLSGGVAAKMLSDTAGR